MQTKNIKVWNGVGEPTDYQMKRNDWGYGDRVRVIGVKQPRPVFSSTGYSSHTNHDGVLVVRLDENGTPRTHDGRLVVDTVTPRAIVEEWATALAKIQASKEQAARVAAEKAATMAQAGDLVARANVLLTTQGVRPIQTWSIGRYGNVTLELAQLRTLVETAEEIR